MSAGGQARPIQAVLIDLDGTLLDTAPDLAEAANRMRGDFGLPPLPQSRIAAFVGKGAEVLVHRALTDRLEGTVDEDAFRRGRASFHRHYHDTNGVASRVFEGVPQALEALRAAGLRLGCVTNKPGEFTRPLLESSGLAPYFAVVVAGDEVRRKKPDPEIVLTGCGRLGVEPDATRLIGDSVNDALAAHAAGCRSVLVETGYNEGEPVSVLAAAPGVDAIFPALPEAARWLLSSARA